MYILIRFYPPLYFFSRVITKADNAMGDNRKNKKQKIKPESPQSNTLDLKRLSKLDLEALLVSHPPTHAQRDKRKNKQKKKKLKKKQNTKAPKQQRNFHSSPLRYVTATMGKPNMGRGRENPALPVDQTAVTVLEIS